MADKLVVYKIEDQTTGKTFQIEGPEGASEDELNEFMTSYIDEQPDPAPQVSGPVPVSTVDAPQAAPVQAPAQAAPQVAPKVTNNTVTNIQQTGGQDAVTLTPEEEAEYIQLAQDDRVSYEDLNAWGKEKFAAKNQYFTGFGGGQAGLDAYRKAAKEGTAGTEVEYTPWTNELGPTEASATSDNVMIRAYQDAVQYGTPGWLARTYADWTGQGMEQLAARFPDATPEQLEQMQEEVIAYVQKGTRAANIEATADDPLIPWLAGQIIGSAGIEDFLPGGVAVGASRGAAKRIGVAAATEGVADAAYQGVDILDGVQDEFSYEQAALAPVIGAGFRGGIEAGGAIASTIKNRMAKPEVPSVLDAVDNPDAPTGIAFPTGRKNSKEYKAGVTKAGDGMVAHVRSITEGWQNSPEIEVYDDFKIFSDLDDDALGVKSDVTLPDGTVKSVVRLNATNLLLEAKARKVSPEDVVSSITYHEALGHYGLSQKFGDDLDAVLEGFYNNANTSFRNKVDKWLEDNPDEYKNAPNRAVRAMEEVLAEMSEQGRLPVTFKDRIANKIKEYAREMGLSLKVSEREVKTILGMAHGAVINGKGRDVSANGFRFKKVYHGSPHDFDEFDHSKMGTGEGQQAFGWGTYLTETEAVAEGYRDRLTDSAVIRDPESGSIVLDDDTQFYEWADKALESVTRQRRALPYKTEDGRPIGRKYAEREGKPLFETVSAFAGEDGKVSMEIVEDVIVYADGTLDDGQRWNDTADEAKYKYQRQADEAERTLSNTPPGLREQYDREKARLEQANAMLELFKKIDKLKPKKSKNGRMYEVELPDQAVWLSYDERVANQPELIDAIRENGLEMLTREEKTTLDFEEAEAQRAIAAIDRKLGNMDPFSPEYAKIAEQYTKAFERQERIDKQLADVLHEGMTGADLYDALAKLFTDTKGISERYIKNVAKLKADYDEAGKKALTASAEEQRKLYEVQENLAREMRDAKAYLTVDLDEAWATGPEKASKWLDSIGVTGTRYLDGMSRGSSRDTYNYVVYNDKTPKITNKYSKGSGGSAANDNARKGERLRRPKYPDMPKGLSMSSPKSEWAKYYRAVSQYHDDSITYLKQRMKTHPLGNNAKIKSIQFHDAAREEARSKAGSRAEMALGNKYSKRSRIRDDRTGDDMFDNMTEIEKERRSLSRVERMAAGHQRELDSTLPPATNDRYSKSKKGRDTIGESGLDNDITKAQGKKWLRENGYGTQLGKDLADVDISEYPAAFLEYSGELKTWQIEELMGRFDRGEEIDLDEAIAEMNSRPDSANDRYMKRRTREEVESDDMLRAEYIVSELMEDYTPTIRSLNDAKAAAKEVGMTPAQIKKFKTPEQLDKRIFALENAAVRMNSKVLSLMEKAEKSDTPALYKQEVLDAIVEFKQVNNYVLNQQAEVARALRAMRDVTFTKKKLTELNELLADFEGNNISGFASDDVFNRFAKQVQELMNVGNTKGATKMLGDVMTPYWWQYILSARHSMMLSGLGTHVKNAYDNAAMLATELEEIAVSLPGFYIRKGLQKAGADVQDGVSPQEIAARAYGLMRALLDAETYSKTWITYKEGASTRKYSSKIEMSDAKIKGLSAVQDFLHATDTFFRAFHNNANLYTLGVREARKQGFKGLEAFEEGSAIAQSPTPEMRKEMTTMTDVALLVDNPSLWSAKLESLKAITPNMKAGAQAGAFVANYMLPFFRVTDRLLFQKIRRLGPVALLDRVTREQLAKGGPDMDVALGRMAMSSALIWYYWDNAGDEEGKVVGNAIKDRDKLAALEAGGYKPNSINEGDQYTDASALNLSIVPLDLQTAIAANIATIRQRYEQKKDDGETTAAAMAYATRALLTELQSVSFADNLTTFIEPFADNEEWEQDTATANVVASSLSQFVPAALRQYNNMVSDPYKRDTTGDKSFGDKVKGRVMSGIPGLSDNLPLKYDLYGEPMEKGTSLTATSNYQKIKKDPVSKELQRLERVVPEAVVRGAPSSFEHEGEKIKLTAEGKQEWQRVQGYYLTAMMKEEIQTPEWKALSDADKILTVKDVRKEAYGLTKEYMLPLLGVTEEEEGEE